MTDIHYPVRVFGLSLSQVQATAIWLMMASSFFVIVEPAPCDLMFVVALFAYLWSGLSLSALVLPMVIYLLLYNFGGFISFLEISNEGKAGMFVLTSAYMAVSAIFFAFYVAYDPLRRMAILKNGYLVGGFIASVIGIAGYFDVGGMGETLSPIGRAQGTFKDPNVLSTYLILPSLMLVQGFMLGTQKHRLVSACVLIVMLAALFLAFSRGAWISFALAAMLLVLITFMLTPSPQLRARIVLISLLGLGLVIALLGLLLTIPEVGALFADRATLVKDYDAGERGRFGIQINSIPYLLERPLGFGPTLYRRLFSQDPHNVYLNAFASYGWLGGITYLLLILSTLIIGAKTILIRTPWQHVSIVIFCALTATIAQGIQIDTDHWRHFYWMLGLMWGLYAASAAYVVPYRTPA